MSFNNQQWMRQQQEQARRRQQEGWAYQQEQKRKRHERERAMRQSGGVNINDVENFDLGGDIVGRDKVHRIDANYQRDEKSGFSLFVEQVFTFVITFPIVAIIFGGIATMLVGMTEGGEVSEDILFIVIPVALVFAYISASSVSKYKD